MVITVRCFVFILLALLASISPAFAGNDTTPSLFSPDATPIEDWQARLELAALLANTGRYDEAADQYRRILDEKPGNEQARLGLARVLMWSGRQEEAGALLAQVDPSLLTDDDRMLLVDLAISQKEYAKAEGLLRTRLKNDPRDLKARLRLAEVLSWTDRFEDSADEYARILAVRPDDIQVRRRYAQVLAWAGKNDAAIMELRKTLGE